MGVAERIFKISYVGKNQVSERGDFGVFENVFRIEKPTNKDIRKVHVSYQPLLPAETDNDYVDIDYASDITGLTVEKLKALCSEGYLEYVTDGKSWFIKRDDLEKYTGNS